MTTRETPTCAGCGEPVRPYPYTQDQRQLVPGTKIMLAPDVEVWVCKGRTDGSVKRACAVKARLDAGLCPGCGDDHKGNTLLHRGLCQRCVDELDRVRQLTDKPVQWYVLDRHGLFGYVSRDDEANPLGLRVVQLLGQLLAVAGRRYQDTGDHHNARCVPAQSGHGHWVGDAPLVELDADQVPLVEELAGLIWQVIEAERRGGIATGSSLLHQLAVAKRGPDEFEDLRLKYTQPVPDFDRRCHHCRARSVHGPAEHAQAIVQHLERLVPRQPDTNDEG